MDVVTNTADQIATVLVRGEIDIATIDELRACIDKARRSMPEAIDLDLRGVTFMGCSGINLLMEEIPKATRSGARIVIGKAPAIDRLLQLIRGDDSATARFLARLGAGVWTPA